MNKAIAAFIFLLSCGISFAQSGICDGTSFKFVDDPELDKIIAGIRTRFLANRPVPFDRFDVTILIPQVDGSWRRGSYNPYELAYPASTVKLAYMVAAIQWCKDNGMRYDCLDRHVRPMIKNSDNLETGQRFLV